MSSDGRFVAANPDYGRLWGWDLAKGGEPTVYPAHADLQGVTRFGGAYLRRPASGHWLPYRGLLRVDLRTARRFSAWPDPIGDREIYDAVVDPSGRYVAVTIEYRVLALLDDCVLQDVPDSPCDWGRSRAKMVKWVIPSDSVPEFVDRDIIALTQSPGGGGVEFVDVYTGRKLVRRRGGSAVPLVWPAEAPQKAGLDDNRVLWWATTGGLCKAEVGR